MASASRSMNELLLKAGEFGCWERGRKFSAKNTGDIPATFFWGLGEPPEGVTQRMLEPQSDFPDAAEMGSNSTKGGIVVQPIRS